MRSGILAMTVALTLVTGQIQAGPPKSSPADVGGGHVAWFDITTSKLPQSKELGGTVAPGFPFNLPDGIGAIALVLDPSGHPVGMYSRAK